MMRLLRHALSLVRPDFQRRYMARSVKLHRSSRIFHGERLTLGRHIYVGPRCMINAEGGMSIGDGTVLAPEVVILSSTHDYRSGERLPFDVYDVHRPVTIGKAVWIGYGAMICPGVTLGDGAVVAMGSVVTGNVGKGEVVGGNPARVIATRETTELASKLAREDYFIKHYWSGRRPRKVLSKSDA